MNEAFIDGQNLEFSTTNADEAWKVDLKRFRVYLEQKYSVGRAYYFKMVDYLIEKGKFEKILAPNRKNMSSLYKLFDRKYYTALNDTNVRRKIELSNWKKISKKTGIA